jgi:hypothetical protein
MDVVYLPPSLRRLGPEDRDASPGPDHGAFVYDLVEALRPRLSVDLGAGEGRALFAITRSIVDHEVPGSVYAVDPYPDDTSPTHGTPASQAVTAHLHEHFRGIAYVMKMSAEGAIRHFEDGSIDLLRIDPVRLGERPGPLLGAWLPKLRATGALLVAGVADGEHLDVAAAWHARTGDGGLVFPWAEGLGVWMRPATLMDDSTPILLRLLGGEREGRADVLRFYEHVARHRALAAEIRARGGLRRKGR